MKSATYKVFKVGRVSRRITILRKGLNEADAQKVVSSYPDSTRSMVCYTKE